MPSQYIFLIVLTGILAGALLLAVALVWAARTYNDPQRPVQVRLVGAQEPLRLALVNPGSDPVTVALRGSASDPLYTVPATPPPVLAPDPRLQNWAVGIPQAFRLENMPPGEDIALEVNGGLGDSIFLLVDDWSSATTAEAFAQLFSGCPEQLGAASATYTAPVPQPVGPGTPTPPPEAATGFPALLPCQGGVGRITISGADSGFLRGYDVRVVDAPDPSRSQSKGAE